MITKISAVKARQNLGQVMNEVALRGDNYIVERAGKPLVAIIPIEQTINMSSVPSREKRISLCLETTI